MRTKVMILLNSLVMFYLCLNGKMFVNKDQMLIMFSLTVLVLMVSHNPFFFFLSHVVATALEKDLLTCSDSLERGRSVLRPKRQRLANLTATASITHTTSLVGLNNIHQPKSFGLAQQTDALQQQSLVIICY